MTEREQEVFEHKELVHAEEEEEEDRAGCSNLSDTEAPKIPTF